MTTAVLAAPRSVSPTWQRFRDALRRHPTAIAGALVLIAMVLLAVLAPWLGTTDPQALSPVQRANNDAIQARRVQSAKNFHHAEEVDELDETAVNSVRDDKQQEGHEKNPEKRDEDETEEKVEIEALGEAGHHLHLHHKPSNTSSLDVSA